MNTHVHKFMKVKTVCMCVRACMCLSTERQRSWKTVFFQPEKLGGGVLPKNYIHQRRSFVKKFKTKTCALFKDFYQQGTLLASERRILGFPASFEVPLLLYLQMAWHNQPIDVPCLVNPALVHSPTTGLEAEVELPVTWGAATQETLRCVAIWTSGWTVAQWDADAFSFGLQRLGTSVLSDLHDGPDRSLPWDGGAGRSDWHGSLTSIFHIWEPACVWDPPRTTDSLRSRTAFSHVVLVTNGSLGRLPRYDMCLHGCTALASSQPPHR